MNSLTDQELVVPLLLNLARALPLSLLLPCGDGVLPTAQRLMFGLALACVRLPSTSTVPSWSSEVLLDQLAIGFIVSLPLLLLVGMVAFVAEIFDYSRGVNIVTSFDPHQERNSALAALGRLSVWVGLLTTGAVQQVVWQLLHSYSEIPTTTKMELSALGALGLSYFDQFIPSALAALIPLLMLNFLVELSFAGCARFVPGLRPATESLGVKTLVLTIALLLAVRSGAVDQLSRLACHPLLGAGWPSHG